MPLSAQFRMMDASEHLTATSDVREESNSKNPLTLKPSFFVPPQRALFPFVCCRVTLFSMLAPGSVGVTRFGGAERCLFVCDERPRKHCGGRLCHVPRLLPSTQHLCVRRACPKRRFRM